jgi:Big-like domain-containing protein
MKNVLWILFLSGALACQTAVEIPTNTAVALHVAPSNFDGPFAVELGTDIVLVAIPIAADSVKLGGPVVAAWSSSDTLIATVNNEGRVHTRCVGTAVISAVANEGGSTLRGSRAVTIASGGSRCE